MIDDDDLIAATDGRVHWRLEADAAVYAPPEAAAVVSVRPVLRPTHRDRYRAAIVDQAGTAHLVKPFATAVAVVQWAETRARLN